MKLLRWFIPLLILLFVLAISYSTYRLFGRSGAGSAYDAEQFGDETMQQLMGGSSPDGSLEGEEEDGEGFEEQQQQQPAAEPASEEEKSDA